MRRTTAAALLVAALSSHASAGGEPAPDPGDDTDPHFALAVAEAVAILGITTVGYHFTQSSADFDLKWDWSSWRRKLTFDAVRFDTDPWGINTVRHPLMSVALYQAGRTNNLGMLGSEALTVAADVLWEFVIEYREYPSINDLIFTGTTGLEIGEPMWQIAQLWRGGVLTVGDRLTTTLFSPLDGVHDLLRQSGFRWTRPAAWRSITLDAGVVDRSDGTRTRADVVIGEDIDLVADRRYVSPGPQEGAIQAGTWSRLRSQVHIGDAGEGTGIVGTLVESHTALAGHYEQDDQGRGLFLGVGTAFTYRRDRLADQWDHVAIAHVVGPQLQLSYRTPALAVRWDAAAYGDFALIDAHVFGLGSPFPKPPPADSLLQAQGYYPGLGATGTTRLRFDTMHWSLDGELEGLSVWQINGADRVEHPPVARSTTAVDPHGCSDQRLYARAEIAYRMGTFRIAATAGGEVRRGTSHGDERQTTGTTIGLLGQLEL